SGVLDAVAMGTGRNQLEDPLNIAAITLGAAGLLAGGIGGAAAWGGSGSRKTGTVSAAHADGEAPLPAERGGAWEQLRGSVQAAGDETFGVPRKGGYGFGADIALRIKIIADGTDALKGGCQAVFAALALTFSGTPSCPRTAIDFRISDAKKLGKLLVDGGTEFDVLDVMKTQPKGRLMGLAMEVWGGGDELGHVELLWKGKNYTEGSPVIKTAGSWGYFAIPRLAQGFTQDGKGAKRYWLIDLGMNKLPKEELRNAVWKSVATADVR
ncbi:hypothetical protein, partial [Streptomyces sp. NPDC096030]|uniref:hypothetical protein n=1 Tax=Streptomyces sp. NPDC096030 TaxID=3155423 RepID=UPI00331DCA70